MHMVQNMFKRKPNFFFDPCCLGHPYLTHFWTWNIVVQMTIKVLGGELPNMFRTPKVKVTKEQILALPTFKCLPANLSTLHIFWNHLGRKVRVEEKNLTLKYIDLKKTSFFIKQKVDVEKKIDFKNYSLKKMWFLTNVNQLLKKHAQLSTWLLTTYELIIDFFQNW